MVIDTLDGVDGDKKCFRMIGGVLVERTVKEVAPALTHNKDKVPNRLPRFYFACA